MGAITMAAEIPQLGQFSVSLKVKDLKASRSFYEVLGFNVFEFKNGPPPGFGEKWIILQNGSATIGLFQGGVEKNTLTFNPPDVRAVQKGLKERGAKLVVEADEKSNGPAFCLLTDPDGNPVLLDQH